MFYAKLLVTSAMIGSMLLPIIARAAEGPAEKAIRERIAALQCTITLPLPPPKRPARAFPASARWSR